MADFGLQSRIDRINQLGDETRNRIIDAGEDSIAFTLYIDSIAKLERDTQRKFGVGHQYNKMKLLIVEGQVDQYAEKYDQIERSMRHYG